MKTNFKVFRLTRLGTKLNSLPLIKVVWYEKHKNLPFSREKDPKFQLKLWKANRYS